VIPSRDFIQTVAYEVGELQVGGYASWSDRAGAFYGQVAGLLRWEVLRQRTGPIRFMEIFTWRDRDAFVAAQGDPDFQAGTDTLLAELGGLVDMESVAFNYHSVLRRVEGPGDAPSATEGAA